MRRLSIPSLVVALVAWANIATVSMPAMLEPAQAQACTVNGVACGTASTSTTDGLTPVSAPQAAAAAPVQSVAGRTGAIGLTHGDIGDFTAAVQALAPSLAPYLTSTAAAQLYQPVGAYQPAGSYLTTSAAAAAYQPLGSYVTPTGLATALQPYATTSAMTAAVAAVPSNTISGGPFTVASTTNPLPTCTTALLGKVAPVSDLGGGADNVVCAAGYWKHIRLGTPAANSTCGTVTITPLVSAPIEQLTCSSFATGASLNIATSNLYPGEEFYIQTPTTLGGLLTAIPVSVGGASTTMSMAAAKTYDYVVNASMQLMQLAP